MQPNPDNHVAEMLAVLEPCPFVIGDKVAVNADALPSEFSDGWRGVEGWVVGIDYQANFPGGYDITISERFPPKRNGDLTDGFKVHELTRLNTRDLHTRLAQGGGEDGLRAALHHERDAWAIFAVAQSDHHRAYLNRAKADTDAALSATQEGEDRKCDFCSGDGTEWSEHRQGRVMCRLCRGSGKFAPTPAPPIAQEEQSS